MGPFRGVFEVFADTLVVCSITALAILTSFDSATIRQMGLDGAELSMAAFGSVYGIAGRWCWPSACACSPTPR